MAGIFQTDSVIFTAIQLGIEDFKKNPWLVSHMLNDYTSNSYLNEKYGQNQINACLEWLQNNNINVVLRPRNDKDEMPLVVIAVGNGREKEEMKHMGDASTESVILLPQEVGKPIPYVVKPFTPISYDINSGILEIDPETEGLDGVAAGMILVDPSNGQGFIIIDILPDGIQINPGTELEATQFGIVPQYPYYKANIEHTFYEETVNIDCYCHGDPQTVQWLHSIILYSILRYRESLLEANGFTQSSVSSGPLGDDPYYSGADGEQAFVRSIMLSGQTEHTWIKQPRRFIEKISIRKETEDGFIGGIQIMSNLDTPDFIDQTQEPWTVIKEDEE